MPKAYNKNMKNNQITRYYKKYQKAKLFPSVYPSPYDSCLIYYNFSQTFTDAVTSNGFFAAAYRVQRYAQHVALRPYFNQYRVEKVTMSVIAAEPGQVISLFLATTHGSDGATTLVNQPNLDSIRNYKDCRICMPNEKVNKISWYMSTTDSNEYTWRDVNLVGQTDDSEYSMGGPQCFFTMKLGAGDIVYHVFVKYKVRYMGKQAINI